MTYPHIENCSAKNCSNIPDYKHDGLRIVLCTPCYETSGFKKHFKLINEYKLGV